MGGSKKKVAAAVRSDDFAAMKQKSSMFSVTEQETLGKRANQAWEAFPADERAWIYFEGVVRYQDILVIDDVGDREFEGPTLYVADGVAVTDASLQMSTRSRSRAIK